jgi:hypothetical protein
MGSGTPQVIRYLDVPVANRNHMDYSNSTRNQHFVPQVEQRLNAANPFASLREQRIFSFKVHERGSFTIRLENRRGRLISSNLSLDDLFTFDVASDRALRFNFETSFQRFEQEVAIATGSLLQKLALGDTNVGSEITSIFTAKLLNFARNPFSVAKILNTFGVLANYEPTAPDARRMFERVLNGRKPHQVRICSELGISDTDYGRWLRMLFMLFVESGEGNLSMLESMVKAVFEQKSHAAAVMVCSYSEARCLLSDRGFNQFTDRQDQIGLEFNLRHNAFIRYLFADHAGLVPYAPRELIERHQKQNHPVQLYYLADNLECLRAFNRNAIYFCHNRVFCSSREGILL